MLLHSTALRVHQPFDTVMENSGVKTGSSEQTMLSDKAHISLVTDSSSEEDSETDDQSYPPRGVCSNLAGLCCSYRAKLEHTPWGGNRTGHLSLNGLRSYL